MRRKRAPRGYSDEPFPTLDLEALKRFAAASPLTILRSAEDDADAEIVRRLHEYADELTLRRREEADRVDRDAALARAREQDRPLLGAREWVTNPYYTGAISLWPSVRDLFCEIVESKANLIVLGGGSGAAKSFLGALLTMRTIYEIGSKARPHQSLGDFSATAPFRFALMHLNENRARSKLLRQLVGMVRTADWFREHYPPQLLAYSGVDVHSLKFQHVHVDPVKTHHESVVSDDVVGVHVSECNEYAIVSDSARARDGGTYDVGYRVWRECLNRIRSRFHTPLDPAVRIVFDSAARYETDLTRRIAEELPTLGFSYVDVQRSNWEMRPGKNKPPFFDFAIPRKGARGEVVETSGRRAELEQEGRKIAQVPRGDSDEYYLAAKDSPDQFARDAGGWSTDAINRWVEDLGVLDFCAESRAAFLADLGLEDVVARFGGSFMPGHTTMPWDALCTYNPATNSWRPRVLSNVPRVAHFDLASSGEEHVGFACAAMSDRNDDGVPTVWYDFALRLMRSGREYDYEQLRQFLYDLERHGFRFRLVTFDSYQSVDFRQILGRRGYHVEQISLVRTTDGYRSFAPGLSRGRVLLRANEPILHDEFRALEQRLEGNRAVIKHREGGEPRAFDDVVQAVAAVYWQTRIFATEGVATASKANKPADVVSLRERIERFKSDPAQGLEEQQRAALDVSRREIERARRVIERKAARATIDEARELRRRGARF